jgi:8-oxo-dGTP pyrophosphatase MutT (NUDIX family)
MNLYEFLQAENSGQPWRNVETFESAFLTDFLQEAIERGIKLTPVLVEGGWLEFDTPRDLMIARNLIQAPRIEVIDFDALPSRPSVVSAGGVAIRQQGTSTDVLLVGSGIAGEWRIPKGMLERAETVQAAACREVQEETGVPVKIERFVASEDWNYTYDGREWWERCYFHSFSPLDDVAPQPDSEHPVAAWIPATEALRGMMYENERRTIAAALKK